MLDLNNFFFHFKLFSLRQNIITKKNETKLFTHFSIFATCSMCSNLQIILYLLNDYLYIKHRPTDMIFVLLSLKCTNYKRKKNNN